MNPSTTNIGKKRSIKYAYSSISGIQPFRNSHSIQFESSLERDFIVQQETDPAVSSIESQPYTLEYKDHAGRIRRYTPDYLVNYKGSPWPIRKSELIEVKPSKILAEKMDEFKPKFLAAINYCKHNNLIFHIRDEKRIRNNCWKNGMFMRRVRHFQYGELDPQSVLNQLRQYEVLTIQELINSCFKDSPEFFGFNFICKLMYDGHIQYDINELINLQTEIWSPNYD